MKIRSSKQARDDIKRLVSTYPGLVALAQDLLDLSDLEREVQVAEQRIGEAKGVEDSARVTASELLSDAQKKADELLAAAKSAAEQTFNSAQERAAKVEAEAKAKAESLVSAASIKATSTLAHADAHLAAAHGSAKPHLDAAKEAREALSKVERELADKSALLAEAEKRLTELRSKLGLGDA